MLQSHISLHWASMHRTLSSCCVKLLTLTIHQWWWLTVDHCCFHTSQNIHSVDSMHT